MRIGWDEMWLRLGGWCLILAVLGCPDSVWGRQLEWGGGMVSGLVWNASATNWLAEGQREVFVAGDDAVFTGLFSGVTLGCDLEAGRVRFVGTGGVLRIGEHKLAVTNGIVGVGYCLDFDGSDGCVELKGASVLSGLVSGDNVVRIRLVGGETTFNGRLNAAGSGRSRTFLEIGKGSRFYVATDAEINQQMRDMVNARGIYVLGAGLDSTLEFAAGFDADKTGFPDMERWGPNGFSELYVSNVTVVTHSSRSLPSVHRKSSRGVYSHQGVFSMQGGVTNAWVVRTEKQVYDGLFVWSDTLLLHASSDLLLTGHDCENGRCYFGTVGGQSGQLVKAGAGRVDLMGTQSYGVGTVLRVEEGALIVHTDPCGTVGGAGSGEGTEGARPGVLVGKSGTVGFRTLGVARIASLRAQGMVRIGRELQGVHSAVDVAGDAFFEPSAELRVWLDGCDLPQVPLLTVAGIVEQGGRLVVLTKNRLVPGSYRLFSAGQFSGDFQLVLPAGTKGVYADGLLVVEE